MIFRYILPILLTLFLAVPGWAEIHYVTPNGGTPTHNGSSWTNAFSRADFNNSANWSNYANTEDNKIGPGDTVYFSGTFTSSNGYVLTPQGSGTAANPIILDGYEAGNNDISRDTGLGAKVYQLDNENYFCFYLNGKSYITIQDFELDGGYNAVWNTYNSNYNRYKRNIVHDTLDDGISIRESYNIIVGGALSDGNHFYSCGCGTGSADVVTLSASYIVVSYNWMEGGPRSDRGIDGVTLNETSHHILIEYNRIESHRDTVGANPTVNRVGTAYNPALTNVAYDGQGEDGIDIKKNCHDVVIRGNYIYNEPVQAVNLHLNPYNIWIYGNNFVSNNGGLLIYGQAAYPSSDLPPRNIHIWSNIFDSNIQFGLLCFESPPEGATPTEEYQIGIHNNVFYNNASSPPTDSWGQNYCALWASPGDKTGTVQYFQVLNNVFQQNRPNGTSGLYYQINIGGYSGGYDTGTALNTDPTCKFDRNVHYHTVSTNLFRWWYGSSSYYTWTLATAQANTGNGLFDNDRWENPGMANPASHQFWAASAGSAIVGTGIQPAMSLPGRIYFQQDNSVYVDVDAYVGLDSATNWSGLIPSVVWKNFTAGAWDKGAFPYGATAGGVSIPKIRNYFEQQNK